MERNNDRKVIRGGTVIDGSGGAPIEADVLLNGARIAEVGPKLSAAGAEEIDARGCLVIPGLIDPHTHYDGQVTWDQRLAPSTMNGVTTAVIGNCGIGFAPCSPDDRETLMFLMQGIEDIPVSVMRSGLPWTWRSFPEYMDFLAGRQYDADIAATVPHSTIRVHTMGRRGLDRAPATDDDLAAMHEIIVQGMRAGAVGFSTSRLSIHKTPNGDPIPSFGAGESELLMAARALRQAGAGWFQLIADFDDADAEMDMLERVAAASGRPLTFSLLQKASRPREYRHLLARITQANERGLPITGQVIPRTTGILMGFQTTEHPFSEHTEYKRIAHLPFAQQLEQLRRPEVRERMLAERSEAAFVARKTTWEHVFPLGRDDLNYEPAPEDSIAARAQRLNVAPEACAYDAMLQDDGCGLLLRPMSNFADGNFDAVAEMIQHPHTIIGLGDGGAHVGQICDSSALAFLLSYWTRDRDRGKVDLAWAVKRSTRDNAIALGLADRGLVASGFRADLNIIDYDRFRLKRPHVVHDLPSGGRRLLQECDGIVSTLVAGEPTHWRGESTGALPGRLVRGAQPDPVGG